MIQLRELVKRYGPVLALDRLTLDIERGHVVGVLGPNGAGKTTTLRILTGFMPPTSGSAVVNGHDVLTDGRAARQSIGYLPESTPLYPEMRVVEQLHYFGRLHGMKRADRKRRIEQLTEVCGLTAIIRRPIGHLSKGNRQRVGIAQALLHDPPVVILDEPTVGLDPGQIGEMRRLVTSLGESKTVVISTHILSEVERTCDRVVIIAGGRLVADGSPADLKAQVRTASRVLIEVKAPAADVSRALAALPDVGKVETSEAAGWTTALVTAKQGGRDIRQLVGGAVAQRSWPLRELRPETASLEAFYQQATTAANHAEPARAA